MDEAVDRNNYMIDMLKNSGITNYERSLGLKATESHHPLLYKEQYGCLIAHLDTICKVANGPDDYAIILEDDADLLVSQRWNFTWKEFFDRVPEFDIIQLFTIAGEPDEKMYQENTFENVISFKKWRKRHFSAAAYLITKEYAKTLEQKFIKDPKYLSQFDNVEDDLGPVADYAIYAGSNSYSTTIFSTKILESQISYLHEIPDFLNLIAFIDEELDKDFTLDRLFTTYESDNGSVQA